VVAAPALRLEPHPRGTLLSWAQPEPDRQYVIASDTAGGGSRADHAAAIVLDGETCRVVAAMHARADPHVWGPRCARLGWFYNEAVLAFETLPSAHGLAAAVEAKNLGYPNLYFRRRNDTYGRPPTDQLGFHTNVETKPLVIARIKKQMDLEDCDIPWVDLLEEMDEQFWDDNERMVSEGHDDRTMTYGIALVVRDDCYFRGILKPPEKKALTYTDRYWNEQEARMARKKPQRRIPTWLR
jgi:hypothetical protein